MPPRKNKHGNIVFRDYPEFTPNLTPKEIFQLGSFGVLIGDRSIHKLRKKTITISIKNIQNHGGKVSQKII